METIQEFWETLGRGFSDSSAWLAGLPEWQQQVIVGLLLLGVSGGFAAIGWLIRVAWRRRQLRKTTPPPPIGRPLAPSLSLFETIDAIPNASMRIQAALQGMTAAMRAWQLEVSARKGKPPVGKSATAKYWSDQGRSLNRMNTAIETQRRALRAGIELLGKAAVSRMYWHDKRGTASDLLTEDARRTFSQLRTSVQNNRQVFSNTKPKLEGIQGWHATLDNAASRHREILDKLDTDLSDLEALLTQMLAFRLERTGWRGWTRKQVARLAKATSRESTSRLTL